MIFPHADLQRHFSILYKYINKDQRLSLKMQGVTHTEYSSIVGYFKRALEESELSIDDIVQYQNEIRIENNTFLLNFDSAANCAAALFVQYLQEIIMPDPSLGIYMGVFYIAGTQYRNDISEIIQTLKINDPVHLVHESQNPYDARAIKVLTQKGDKLGYIPKSMNYFPHSMIENGQQLIGQIKKLKWTKEDYQIKVMLYCQK